MTGKTAMKRTGVGLALAALLAALLAAAGLCEARDGDVRSLRIIATSDLHGKFFPWDYALDAESPSGSMTQLATALAQYRTDHTLLVDAGDTIQDNSADLFVGDAGVHPMIQALNALDYDAWVTGNHEYNYGMDVVKKTIADLDCTALTGNVYDADGAPIADGCAIFDIDGVRYEINLSREPGARIENLTWPDGTPVGDDDAFALAVNNYCANAQLLAPDVVFEAGDTPTLGEMDVRGEIAGIRELIRDYIVHVKGGVIRPECDGNWKITGCETSG